MNNDEIILHLSLIDGVGPSTVLQLVKSKPWDMDLTDIYDMNQVEMMKIFQLSSNKAQAIVSGLSDRSRIDRELELIEQCQVQWTTMFNDQYPEMLKHVHLPPPILYWRGMLRTDCTQNVAVVGSRNVNYYGVSVIESIVPGLVGAGWSVVSGGAIGADTVAHKVAINSGGYTIAVLGSGLLNPYPATNKRLFSDVLDKRGALLSIFPMATAAAAGNFPVRNRIIAGLSVGCLVVQAAQKSGALITARYALDSGREVFAVPGAIDDDLSTGCHDLIRQGAKLVSSVGDILEEFGPTAHSIEREKQLSLGDVAKNQESSFKAEGPQAIVMRCCSKPCCVDELAEQTGMAMHELYALLFELELSGSIHQQANGMWCRR